MTELVPLEDLAAEIGVKEDTLRARLVKEGLSTVASLDGGYETVSRADADALRRFYEKHGYSPAWRERGRERVQALARVNAMAFPFASHFQSMRALLSKAEKQLVRGHRKAARKTLDALIKDLSAPLPERETAKDDDA